MAETAFEVIMPGLATTVQDLGRRSGRQHGVPQGGAMDPLALQAANLLAGNLRSAAALEIAYAGPILIAHRPLHAAICGADLQPTLDGVPLRPNASFFWGASQTLSFGRLKSGVRAYLAVAGGIDVPEVLGSRSTYLPAGFGGLEGRALRAGDRLAVGDAAGPATAAPRRASLPNPPGETAVVRVLLGPHAEGFGADTIAELREAEFAVSAQADRMGYRLDGPPVAVPAEYRSGIVSEAVPLGTIQVSPDGRLTILMADGPTIGGYPKIAAVILADIPVLAQCAPGIRLRFAPVALEEAHALLREQERGLRALAWALRWR